MSGIDPSLSAEQRRKLALKKLAQVFNQKKGGGRGGADREAEKRVLQEVLRKTDQREIADLVQCRLTVITADESSSSSSSNESGSDSDGSQDGSAPRGAAKRGASQGGEGARPEGQPQPPKPQPQQLGAILRDIVHGVGSNALNPGLLTPAFWEGAAGGALRAGGAGNEPPPPKRGGWCAAGHLARLREDLAADGFCISDGPGAEGWARAGADVDAMAMAMEALQAVGWPPVFIFMFDAAWALVRGLFEAITPLLGCEEAVLEPSFFAWALSPPPPAGSHGPKVGNNFGLPHRDYTYEEAWDLGGAQPDPQMLCVWTPVTEATLDNGCLVVLPKQSDPLWARADHPGHTRAALEVGGDGPAGGGGAGQVTELRFPVAAARPLPARKGAVIAWHGNTVHWGGACSARAKVPPRKNLAFTFRRAGAEDFCASHLPPLSRAEVDAGLDLGRRLQLVAQSLLLYSRWYSLDRDVVPNAFYCLNENQGKKMEGVQTHNN